MIIKCIEIRDEATCIPAVAIQMQAHGAVEMKYLRRCGYPQRPDHPEIILMDLNDARARVDPYDWMDRTFKAAHLHLYRHFEKIKSGDVVDVRVVLGESEESAKPEIYDADLLLSRP